MTDELAEHRLKRLYMRSWRRGMKEMDLILGPFADAGLERLSTSELDAYEMLLEENDQDLYGWITGRDSIPDIHQAFVEKISSFLRKDTVS